MNAEELEFLNLLETASFVIDVTKDGVPVYAAVNGHTCKVSGLARSDLVGKTAKEIFPSHLGQVAYRRHVQTIRSAKKSRYEISLPMHGQELLITTLPKDAGFVEVLVKDNGVGFSDPALAFFWIAESCAQTVAAAFWMSAV